MFHRSSSLDTLLKVAHFSVDVLGHVRAVIFQPHRGVKPTLSNIFGRAVCGQDIEDAGWWKDIGDDGWWQDIKDVLGTIRVEQF